LKISQPVDFISTSSISKSFILLFVFFCLGGALTEASLNNNRLIPKTISEYPSPINVRTKYTTDEEDYTLSETISFAVLTQQQASQATTILAGFAYDNIYYVFDLEVNAKNYRPVVCLFHERSLFVFN